MGCGGVGGADNSRDGGIVCVAEGLPCFFHASKHCIMYQLPHLSHFCWGCVNVYLEVSEVINQ